MSLCELERDVLKQSDFPTKCSSLWRSVFRCGICQAPEVAPAGCRPKLHLQSQGDGISKAWKWKRSHPGVLTAGSLWNSSAWGRVGERRRQEGKKSVCPSKNCWKKMSNEPSCWWNVKFCGNKILGNSQAQWDTSAGKIWILIFYKQQNVKRQQCWNMVFYNSILFLMS